MSNKEANLVELLNIQGFYLRIQGATAVASWEQHDFSDTLPLLSAWYQPISEVRIVIVKTLQNSKICTFD